MGTDLEVELLLAADANGASLGVTAARSVEDLYREHAHFVWRSLQHFGVAGADLEDLLQEVFVVVHKRLGGFDGRSKVTTWLFGISLRVAARHRRRAYFRRERTTAEPPEQADPVTPEGSALLRDDHRLLERALAKLSLEQRAVFVLFELEGQSCQEIAELVGAPIGTVYSRLHKARARVTRSLEKVGLRPPGAIS